MRSTLARARAELELALEDGAALPADRLLGDLGEAIELLGEVEKAAFAIVSVLVLDDDERLGELTARALRRAGYEAHAAARFRAAAADEVVVFDLGMLPSLSSDERGLLRRSRPIVLTGAVDTGSRAVAADLDASNYLIKPVDIDELMSAIGRWAASRA